MPTLCLPITWPVTCLFTCLSEYGSGSEPSTEGDVFSYGVLLLEIFTGRRPTDNFMDGVITLVKYVRVAYPDKLLNILDASATHSGDTQRIVDMFLYPIFKLGLACCEDSPRHRMKINDVVKELNAIKRACEAHMAVHEF
uniref:Serine-threonine/tyrosine-protein kinase catalytic domain-containing protein n=1 Tax=Aegilops tauschii subsp. strangulata TaxID=200361 RepID=A0A453QBV0_AEGTS